MRALRIYLGAFGAPGHAFPMLALGRRLAQRGHTVTFETWERWRADVEQAGIEFVPAPEYPVFPTRTQPLKPYEAVVRATPPARTAIAARTPDVVVHDILTLAPALAAELEGIPRATLIPHLYPVTSPALPPFSIGARLPRTAGGRALWRALSGTLERGLRQGRQELNLTRRRVGLEPTASLHGGLSPDLCLVATFPQLEYPRAWPRSVRVIGPLLWEPPERPAPGAGTRSARRRSPARSHPPAPAPLARSAPAPLVVIAPSTSHDARQQLLAAALEGLERSGLRVLASVDRRPASRPLRAGRNARLLNWMPYSRTMGEAAAVICHGGHGTIARALVCGTPVLVVPHSGDMAENAVRVDWAGVGVRLPWRLLAPTTIRLALHRLLAAGADGGYSQRASQIASWAAAHDSATLGAELIERLAVRD